MVARHPFYEETCMQLLTWNDALKTDIDVIDRQHRGLVDLINATAARLAADTALGADEVRALLGYLKDYAEVHFSTEEALMALFGLAPDYTDHHHQNHARFLARVGDMMDDIGADGVGDGGQVLAFLADWLVGHIQGEDQRMAQRLHAARQSDAATEATWSAPPPQARGGQALQFADALARGTAVLHASEADVLALVTQSDQAALVLALDANLMPATVIHANAVAAGLLGRRAEDLKASPAAGLFGAGESSRFPVLMSEVMVTGHFEGTLQWLGANAAVRAAHSRLTLLVVHGQTVVLVVFEPLATAARVVHTAGVVPAFARAQAAANDPGATVLSRHVLFKGLSSDELAKLEGASSLVRLGKGQILFYKGEEPAGLYMVISGHISLIVSNNRGDEKVLGIYGAQQVFGEVEVFAGGPCRVTAESLDPSVVLMIPAEFLRRLQASSPGFAGAALAYVGGRLHEAIGEIEALTLHTAMERIIDHLLEHAAINSHGVLEAILPAQKQIIASRINLTPPTLSRAFQQLSEAGLINVSGRYVTIPDRTRLLRFRDQEAAG